MIIERHICSKADISEKIKELLISEFEINDKYSDWLKTEKIEKHLSEYIDSIYAVIETPYVDKVYRDSYYNYFSSKLYKYKRDCIRISFFDGEITEELFRDVNEIKQLQERFLGFIVIRPTEPNIIGRSVLSPKIKKHSGYDVCTVEISTTVDCIKFNIEGFPHSSQDTETITCAETTIWAIMEYFSNKYSDYRTVLPSKIIETLNKVSAERQIPSRGLNIQQISFALKEFGFGTRIYSRKEFGEDFKKLLSCYVESGIPILVAIENENPRTIGHAMLCIGHCKINEAQINLLQEENIKDLNIQKLITSKGLKYYNYDNLKKEFIFIDDNFPAYQKAFLDKPAEYYSDADWDRCKITHFIVPLYPKIYLEANVAKNFVLNHLLAGMLPIDNNSELLIRFFLTSSRSYKNAISLNSSIQADLKTVIEATAMPKFIWVAELTTKNDLKNDEASGLIIIDATEAKKYNAKPLLIGAFNDTVINFEKDKKTFAKNNLTLQKFKMYQNNLKSF